VRADLLSALRAAMARGGAGPEWCAWRVPGRIEVLGKHTDYAGGRSLVCAVEQGFVVAAAPRSDDVVRVMNVADGSEVVIRYAAAPRSVNIVWRFRSDGTVVACRERWLPIIGIGASSTHTPLWVASSQGNPT
jgi:galactokinase